MSPLLEVYEDGMLSAVERRDKGKVNREGGKGKQSSTGKWRREWVVLAGPWLCASSQLFMRQCTCQEPTDKHNSKAERKSNSASMGNAHNSPGETPFCPFLCCPLINREQGYLIAAWFSSRAKSWWNHLCCPPTHFIYLFLFWKRHSGRFYEKDVMP